MLTISINPTYQCNGHCPYCYLGNLIKDDTVLNLQIMRNRLDQLQKFDKDLVIDIFGGEIGMLQENYLNDLILICLHYSKNVTISSNFTINPNIVYNLARKYNIPLFVSWNVERGNINKIAIDNVLKYEDRSNIGIQIVCLPTIINIDKLIRYFESIKVRSITFLQYYPGKFAKKRYNVNNCDYSDFIIRLHKLNKLNHYNINITNLNLIRDANYVPLQSSNIFITPYGQYAVTKYDKDGYEEFYCFDSLNTFNDIINDEKRRYFTKCGTCEYYQYCLAEHWHGWNENDDCAGLKQVKLYMENLKVF